MTPVTKKDQTQQKFNENQPCQGSKQKPINERKIKVKITIHGCYTGVYAVNDDTLVQLKDKFFERLNDEITKIGNSREPIIIGDLNSQIRKKERNNVVGKQSEEQTKLKIDDGRVKRGPTRESGHYLLRSNIRFQANQKGQTSPEESNREE
ncbi:hypothetical protein HUJ04_009987 [Dendroctonus ponderosae]|nr:hypothetical protein HUJ04_009987 [Dendroctonus ponderosae]